MNQKDAVFEAVKALKPHEVASKEPIVLTKQEKTVIQERLFNGFKSGRIEYNHEMPGDEKLSMYVSGLVSNWLRKDKRLNGDRTYIPQRPGSRSLPPRSSSAISLQIPEGMEPAQVKALEELAQSLGGGAVQLVMIRRSSAAADNNGGDNGSHNRH